MILLSIIIIMLKITSIILIIITSIILIIVILIIIIGTLMALETNIHVCHNDPCSTVWPLCKYYML